jgi:transcription elongation GreA/GreB family factor
MLDIKKKLQDEIAALEYELRNELPREILKARAHGDLSENAASSTPASASCRRGWPISP